MIGGKYLSQRQEKILRVAKHPGIQISEKMSEKETIFTKNHANFYNDNLQILLYFSEKCEQISELPTEKQVGSQ
jgi:hypothetical protein